MQHRNLLKMSKDMNKYSGGFTLIELIIVVGIVAIISTVAVTFYGDNITRANRTEARSTLTQTAGSLEKCRSMYGAYDSANCNVAFPVDSETNLFQITGVVAPSTFTLTATPVAGRRPAGDADCTTFTLTNTGMKGATGADPAACW